MGIEYVARKGEGETYDVVNKETDEVRDSHEPPDAKEKAERQVKLLNSIASEPGWQAETND